jgi:hypothetical protein
VLDSQWCQHESTKGWYSSNRWVVRSDPSTWVSKDLGNGRTLLQGTNRGAGAPAEVRAGYRGEKGFVVATIEAFVLFSAGVALLVIVGIAAVVVGVHQEERRLTLPLGNRPPTGSALLARWVLGAHFTYRPEAVGARARPLLADESGPDALVGG